MMVMAYGSVKLPNLQLPSFDGNVLQFQEFWDTFIATVEKNPTLSPVQKLSYLKERLRGRALDTIKGLNICDFNYEVAKELIYSKFGSKQTVLDAHYVALTLS